MPAAAIDKFESTITRHDAFVHLNNILSTRSHEFLQPSDETQQIAILAAKSILDPLANSIADAQIARRKENKLKRKRGVYENENQVLQIRKIHTAGFGTKQVWEQAKRVLDAACNELERALETLEVNQSRVEDSLVDVTDGHDNDVLNEDEQDDEYDIDIEEAEGEEEYRDDDDIASEEDIEADSDGQSTSDHNMGGKKQSTFVQDPNGLNDGFFSIDDFNKQTQFLEQMDARGDDDNPSDEDEVDWDTNPLSMAGSSFGAKPPKSKPRRAGDDDDDDDDDEDEDSAEDGPAFGNANLDDPDSDEDQDDMDMDEDQDLDTGLNLSNANEIRYADFFEPPPKKPSKTKRMRALPKTQPDVQPNARPNEDDLRNDVERAMADVRRDLLDSDDEEDFDDDQEDSENDMQPKTKDASNMSTHEKQKAKIAAEIRRLEAANVAKRDWQLSGEARAVDRPVNSLLEEDLEFERAGKPVPVVTAETSEEIEALIKRRILAREFDEVTRRSAAGLGSASETRKGRIELDDSKPQASLGELYEQDHLRTTDPGYVDKRSAATKKQHDQIDVLWREVNEQLNLLSNLHFKPKRVDIEIRTVQDKPRIAMEDARPVGESSESMLAPQEIYRPESTTSKEVINSGASVSKDEMTREEKLRRRRREKERSKKAQLNKAQVVLGQKSKKSKQQDKNDIISDLKKGNVSIVGKDGDLKSLGNKKRSVGDQISVGAGNFKL